MTGRNAGIRKGLLNDLELEFLKTLGLGDPVQHLDLQDVVAGLEQLLLAIRFLALGVLGDLGEGEVDGLADDLAGDGLRRQLVDLLAVLLEGVGDLQIEGVGGLVNGRAHDEVEQVEVLAGLELVDGLGESSRVL